MGTELPEGAQRRSLMAMLLTYILIALGALAALTLLGVGCVLVLPFRWQGEFNNTVGSLRSVRVSWPGQWFTYETAVEDGERWTYLYARSSLIRKKHHPAKPSEDKKSSAEQKKPSTRRDNLSEIRFWLRAFRQSFPWLEDVVPLIQLKFTCDLTVGTGDPATTGLMYGVVQAFRALFPMFRIRVRPAFLDRKFKGTAEARGVFPLGKVARATWRFYRTPDGKALWRDIQKRRRNDAADAPVSDDELSDDAKAAMEDNAPTDAHASDEDRERRDDDPLQELARQWRKGRKGRQRFFRSIMSEVFDTDDDSPREVHPPDEETPPASEAVEPDSEASAPDAYAEFRARRVHRRARRSGHAIPDDDDSTDAEVIDED